MKFTVCEGVVLGDNSLQMSIMVRSDSRVDVDRAFTAVSTHVA